jgi:hypothetical protein
MAKAQRNPRFRRVALKCKTLLTERDREIIRVVTDHKFLRASHIASLVGGSPQHVRRRLQRLFHLGHLDRPRSQIDYFHEGAGSRELIYSTPGHQVQRFYLEHALMASDIAIAFDRTCQAIPEIRVFHERDIAQELQAPSTPRDRFQWHVDITRDLRIGVRPDLVLQIGKSDDHCFGMERASFFVEADRGTMPVARAGLDQTSILRKLLAYHATWAQGIHRSIFGIDRFRVLVVTTDAERIENMIEACQRIDRGHRLFLFAEVDAFVNAGNVFDIPLINGKGEIDSLLNTRDLP